MAIEAAAAMTRPTAMLNRRSSPTLPPIADEAIALLDLKAASRAVRRGQEIISEGKRCTAVFLLADGIAIRYRILRDGQRQIINLLVPGDFAGVTSCRFESALYSIKTLTPATVLPIPLARLVALFETHPQLAANLFWSFASERAVLGERLIALGRRSAAERIAHFLLELFVRLQRIGLADERSFRLPVTQEMIGDALGLSIPYVNRVLQQLRADGLAQIKDQVVVIGDIDGLSALADFEHHYLRPLSIAEVTAERH
ncbi:MAG TPA: Crp/Fnr family transcriptional regulator [Stellaceae bacterium]|nr:Crp/Fnr family transcriptional regulator [Stellaceae bacterium]